MALFIHFVSIIMCPRHLDRELEGFVISLDIAQLLDVVVLHTYAAERIVMTSIISALEEEVSIPGSSVIGLVL